MVTAALKDVGFVSASERASPLNQGRDESARKQALYPPITLPPVLEAGGL